VERAADAGLAQPAMQANVGAKVSSLVQMNTAQGPLLALATDKVIQVLTPAVALAAGLVGVIIGLLAMWRWP
ncbi:MAG TPA: hypothetical protein PKZ08_11750, partial [Vicinamibacterales bacterium]|nr:hypothetical protein [Vicinamibacterales bacterium]